MARLVGHASASFVVPVSIALVATSYRGVARATAIGIAYGAYGAAGAAAPILLQLIPGEQWPAFVAAIAACLIAIRLASRRTLELQRPTLAERPLVVGVAVWAFGIITLTVGLTWINGGLDNPIRLAMIIGGPVTILGYNLLGSARAGSPGRIVRRRVSVALFVGVVIAISQTAAMLNLPLYFRFVLGYGPTLGVIAVAPLFAALVLAGPVAGFLLERISPRWLVGGGVMVVGAGNLVLWAVASTNTPYLSFVLPCLLIGAGFVIATTVRTAIIFASVPSGLPATAAALNEASISVGSRIGVVIVTALVAQRRPGGLHLVGREPARGRRERRDRGLPERPRGDRHAGLQRPGRHDRGGRCPALHRRLPVGIERGLPVLRPGRGDRRLRGPPGAWAVGSAQDGLGHLRRACPADPRRGARVIEIIEAGPDRIEAVRDLLREYLAWAFTLDSRSDEAPTFQGLDDELAGLPGPYAPPAGRLLAALVDGELAGCVALKPVMTRPGELKRLYVRPGLSRPKSRRAPRRPPRSRRPGQWAIGGSSSTAITR